MPVNWSESTAQGRMVQETAELPSRLLDNVRQIVKAAKEKGGIVPPGM